MSRSILALDLGTDTGYALSRPDHPLIAGAWKFASAKQITLWGKQRITRRCDPRITTFYNTVVGLLNNEPVEQIVFEDVQFSSSTYQTQLWSSFRGALWCAVTAMINHGRTILIECVPTGTLKKFATGHGGATKQMMESALFRLYPSWKHAKLSDDAIDALWLWYWADKHLIYAK